VIDVFFIAKWTAANEKLKVAKATVQEIKARLEELEAKEKEAGETANNSSGQLGGQETGAALRSYKEGLPDSLRPPLGISTDKTPGGDQLEQPADQENGKRSTAVAGTTANLNSSDHPGDQETGAALGSSKEGLPGSLRPPEVPLGVGIDKTPGGDQLEQQADRDVQRNTAIAGMKGGEENGDARTIGRAFASERDSSDQSSREANIAESKDSHQTGTAGPATAVSENSDQEAGGERTSVSEKNVDQESEEMRPDVAEKNDGQEGRETRALASKVNSDQESRAPTGSHCVDEAGEGSGLAAPRESDEKKRKRDIDEESAGADGHIGGEIET
jgi:hypothetical protein